jgi:hypothetical protein
LSDILAIKKTRTNNFITLDRFPPKLEAQHRPLVFHFADFPNPIAENFPKTKNRRKTRESIPEGKEQGRRTREVGKTISHLDVGVRVQTRAPSCSDRKK